MASATQGNTLQDVLKWEQENYHSREAVTIASGQNLDALAVVGKVTKSTPTTGTAAGTNTGNGTCTGVTGGTETQIGAYSLECTAVPTGAATVPTTGTAGTNTGNGTCTGVTGGANVQVGTYTLACTAVAEGAKTVPATGTAGTNTGNGTCTGVADGGAAKTGVYTLKCIATATDGGSFDVVDPDGNSIGTALVGVAFTHDQIDLTVNDGSADYIIGDSFTITVTEADGNGGTFSVTDPDGNLLADATVGVAYTSAQINFTLNDGTTDFAVADSFTIAVTEADHDSGTFKVTAPDGAALPDATVAVAYTNAQINFTLNDGTTDFVVGDSFTITVTEADHDSGTFKVTAPDGAALPDATVGVAYTNAQINFTINDGTTDFVVGDSFTITVTAGTGKIKELSFSAVDGTQDAYGFTIAAYDASSADLSGVAIVRDAIIVATDLVWPTGATTDQKNAALAVLKAAGIVERDEV